MSPRDELAAATALRKREPKLTLNAALRKVRQEADPSRRLRRRFR